MKTAFWILGGITFLILGVFGLQILASERVEVVELFTESESGEQKVTRLWIVDHNGRPYLRAGHDQSAWYMQLNSMTTVKLTRNETTLIYQAHPEAELKATINGLMQAKYTWGDSYIGMLFGRDDSIPIRLVVSPFQVIATRILAP